MSEGTPTDGGKHRCVGVRARHLLMWEMASPLPIKETADVSSGAVRSLLEGGEVARCPHRPTSTGSVAQTEQKAEAAVTARASYVTRNKAVGLWQSQKSPPGTRILGLEGEA